MAQTDKPAFPSLQQSDLNGLVVFAQLAETLSFTATGHRLGISASAVSQTIRALEQRMGIALVNRTTRQVGLTEAGLALLSGTGPALADIKDAMRAVRDLAGTVAGTLRINAPRAVAPLLWAELLVPFGLENPDLEIELHASDSMDAVFAEGFDAGVRLGEDLELDMVAFRISEPFAMGVYASPQLLDEIGRPQGIDDLDPRRCVRFRSTEGRVRNWSFIVEGKPVSVMPAGRAVVDDAASNIAVATAGGGFAYGALPTAMHLIEQGRLERVLAEFSVNSPGTYLYYPHARRTAPKLRALIDFVQRRGRYKAAVMPPSTNTAEPVR